MRTKTIRLYTYSELKKDAKEKARDWYRGLDDGGDNFWSEHVIEDAKTIGKILGIEITNIYWSGFSSQGDGAMFECSRYEYAKGSMKALKEYAPQDETLHAVARALFLAQAPEFYQLYATSKHRDRYYHEGCAEIEVYRDGYAAAADPADALIEALRDFMRWIYRALEREWDHTNADEQVAEALRLNGHEFLHTGEAA